MPITDARAFILAHTACRQTPHAPEISLHVADEATDLWQKTEDELGEIGLPPPFWAFAWAGGQALARYLLDHPEVVAGRSVLDFAAGSGIVAIAAMKAGAARVLAVDIDQFSAAAIALNAERNGVTVEVTCADLIDRLDLGAEVILAGDVCYEKPMAERVTRWLARLAQGGATVLIGDPGRSYHPKDQMEKIAEYAVPVIQALEDSEIKKTAVWRFR